MSRQERQYTCHVCRWQGAEVPTEPGDGALCPNCGVLMDPLSASQTWLVALLLIGGTVGVVVLAAYLLT